jgi:hypothetical protein
MGIDDCADFSPRNTGFIISNISPEVVVPDKSASSINYIDFRGEYQGEDG